MLARKSFKPLIAIVIVAVLASMAVAKPDLVVSKIVITRDKSGLYVEKVMVTVANGCREGAGASYVLVTFKDSERENAKSIYYIGGALRPLKGGESQVQTFHVSEKKIVFGRYILAEADPYKKIGETSEDNNWRSLFPESPGKSTTQLRCRE